MSAGASFLGAFSAIIKGGIPHGDSLRRRRRKDAFSGAFQRRAVRKIDNDRLRK
jgi:ribosome biogenesis SPOUT family RNA methylase Rps3